ncbi:MAG: 4-hydroxy-tetrahydrodipicolinate reductase [Woeseia sp.]|nr:4-hydroxy-tetrahydrodipicolinate reductase [Woeseia sp.]
MSNLNVSLLGAGRMGCELLRAVAADANRFTLAGLWARSDSNIQSEDIADILVAAGVEPRSSLPSAIGNADVVIDFTLPDATAEIVAATRSLGKPLVCGVSGIKSADMQALRAAANDIPVFFARNMSIGIALLTRSAALASAVLGTEFQIDIDDLHHKHKRDAPSGTALLLGEAVAEARGQAFEQVKYYDPEESGATRGQDDIGFSVRREGNHPGTHEVRFTNGRERLVFGHEVSDRRVFADGALRAAGWLQGKAAGFYGMQDLLADLTPRQT